MRNYPHRIKGLWFCLMMLHFCSCAHVGISPSESSMEEADLGNDLQDQVRKDNEEVGEEKFSVIEIEWKQPKSNVTRYLIKYGDQPQNLNREIEVGVGELKTIDHPVHGRLYSYTLAGFSSRGIVYYTLQAGNRFGFSDPTPIAKEEAD